MAQARFDGGNRLFLAAAFLDPKGFKNLLQFLQVRLGATGENCLSDILLSSPARLDCLVHRVVVTPQRLLCLFDNALLDRIVGNLRLRR